MKNIFRLFLTAGSGNATSATRAAEGRKYAEAALCFWNGGYLAFLCLAFLPECMGVLPAAAVAGLGILLGLWLEKRKYFPVLVFAGILGCVMLMPSFPMYGKALLGGMGLYHASVGILPEEPQIGKAFLSGAGFLLGTLFFAGF